MKNIHYASLEIHDVSYKNETEKNLEKKTTKFIIDIIFKKSNVNVCIYIY